MIAESITGALKSSFQKKGPIATFFFHGPTGVGKTDIAHILAEFCFGDKNALVKLKCEQMTQEHE
jgi:ATP-dependent Clp protease ATP-binding subunit ClpA